MLKVAHVVLASLLPICSSLGSGRSSERPPVGLLLCREPGFAAILAKIFAPVFDDIHYFSYLRYDRQRSDVVDPLAYKVHPARSLRGVAPHASLECLLPAFPLFHGRIPAAKHVTRVR